ncbi:MAG: type VI secretion system Vgr family protein [Bryobacteraceae bacterium]
MASTASPIASFTQINRLLSLRSILPENVLLPASFTGSEQVSSLFQFRLEMVCQLENAGYLTGQDLLGTRICFATCINSDYNSGPRRYINGIISRFHQKDNDDHFCYLSAEVVPWLWLLSLDSACRIFQGKTVPEIVESIFEEYRTRFPGLISYRFTTTRSYTKLDYCVQYRESSFTFISRLLEEEGIFYFFEHTEDEHTLILADLQTSLTPSPNQGTGRLVRQDGWDSFENPILSLTSQRELKAGKYTLRDFHFQMPAKNLQVNELTVLSNKVSKEIEVYDYPGEYASRFTEKSRTGEVEGEGERVTRIRMEELESTFEQRTGISLCRGITPGYKFEIAGDGRKEQNYVVTAVEHVAKQTPWYLANEEAMKDEEPYENRFTCLPASSPLRPVRKTPKPQITGPQTAIVVGKKGEEIWTDEFGRVKIQFHWDREGKGNESSSCWVRVSQPWAGKGWGTVSIPRIGQEVIVEFLEGDPDQPIITGRVYNASQMPPYQLPAGGHMMGFRSSSTKGGGGYNEIVIHDAKNDEKVVIHAQKDMSTTVQHDQSTTIVKGNQTNSVLKGNQTNSVVEGSHHSSSKKEFVMQSTDNGLFASAHTEILLKVGDSSIYMDKDGNIVIKGKHILIDADNLTEIKGKPVQINCS